MARQPEHDNGSWDAGQEEEEYVWEFTKEERPATEPVDKPSEVWQYIGKLTHGPLPNRRRTLCEYVCCWQIGMKFS
jgi:hypothetical protein